MKKKIISLIIPVMVLLTLTGCMRMERGIEIKSGGRIGVTVSLAMAEELIDYMYGSTEEFYDDMGTAYRDPNLKVELTNFEEDGSEWYGVKAVGTVKNEEEAEDILSSDDSADVDIETKGFIKKTVTVTLTSDGSSDGMDYSAYGIKDVFSIRVPSKIVSTNGTIDSSDKRLATWDVSDVDFGGNTEKVMTVSYMNLAPVIIGILCILAVIIIIVVVVIVVVVAVAAKKKKRPTQQAVVTDVQEQVVAEQTETVEQSEVTDQTENAETPETVEEVETAESTEQPEKNL